MKKQNMNFLLKSKHWQMLLLFLLGPIVVAIAISYLKTYKDLDGFNLVSTITPGIFYWTMFMSWMIRAIKRINFHHNILTNIQSVILKGCPYFLVLYAIRLINIDLNLWSFFPDFILLRIISWLSHFIMIFLVFFLMYLFAKSLISYKEKLGSYKSNVVIEFLKIYFFPIGIWTVQPILNNLERENQSRNTNNCS